MFCCGHVNRINTPREAVVWSCTLPILVVVPYHDQGGADRQAGDSDAKKEREGENLIWISNEIQTAV